MRPETPGVWAKDLIPNFSIIKIQAWVITPWSVKSIPRGTTYHGTVGCIEPPDQGLYSFVCQDGKGSFSGGSRIWWKGGRELSQTRAKPLFEARSGERGVGQGGGCPPSLCGFY